MASENTPSPPHVVPTTGFDLVESPLLLEEEGFSWYTPESFYPVRIGEIFESRYQVLGKLGFGSVSTAWLCRDLGEHRYVTLKVYVNKHRQATNEIKVLKYLGTIATDHPGAEYIRQARDTFEVTGANGVHRCIVHDPLTLTISDIRNLYGGKLPAEMLKPLIKSLLVALDFLHSEAHVVHTDLQEGNVMLTTIDDTIWQDFEEEERTEPSARKIEGSRVIYASRSPEIPDEPGNPVLCDFGDAQFGKKLFVGEVMPDLYRAPEIVLHIPWDEKIDIWGLGLMIWDLFEGKYLFNERLPTRVASIPAHLARMVALLGPAPTRFLERSTDADLFWDKEGNFIEEGDVPKLSLEDEEELLEGEEKVKFLDFLRKMLQWIPEDRKSAKELMSDDWLEAD